jgi:hypothetical protein
MSTLQNFTGRKSFKLLNCNVSKNVDGFLHDITGCHDSLSQGNLLTCLSQKKIISTFEKSKPGESRGRKATGLK